MKNHPTLKLISLLCLLAMLTQLLCACGTEKPSETEVTTSVATEETVAAAEPNWEALLPLSQDGKAHYKVIRPEQATQTALDTAMALREYLCEQSGLEYGMDTDWFRRGGDPDAIYEYEILVGGTSRTASAEALGELTGDTWCVSLIGNRIVINASFDYLLTDALEYFKSICLLVDGVMMLDTSKCKVEVIPNALIDADLTLRVASYNIKNGAGVNHEMSLLADHFKDLDLDIVGLQEVDIGTSRAKKLDTLKLLAEAAGYPYYAFTKAINTGGGEYGTAILSRYPIVHHESVLLETASGYEQRAYGHAVIEINGANVHFFNTHLSYEKTEIRTPQMAQLAAATASCRGYILTADFNTANLSEFKVFGDAVITNEGKYATYPSSSSAIDNIILESGWEIVDSGMLPSDKSDHNLLWAEIHYKG